MTTRAKKLMKLALETRAECERLDSIPNSDNAQYELVAEAAVKAFDILMEEGE